MARRPPAPGPVSFWRSRRAAALLIAALAFVTYLNALNNPFIYDDFYTVTGNPSIAAEADPRWTVIYMPFRPVVNLSYAIDRRLWGYRPVGYHLTSLALHAANAVLLFVLLLRALRDSRRESMVDGARSTGEAWAAFAGAALFAVHPLQSESAGYISSRSELLCGLFLLSALLFARAAMPRCRCWRRRAFRLASRGSRGGGDRVRRAGAALERGGREPARAAPRLRLDRTAAPVLPPAGARSWSSFRSA